ncbi:hypothetical protein DBR06_SOUSAS3010037, partial [Sousa chinensis]
KERTNVPFYFMLHLASGRLYLIPPNPKAGSPAPSHLWFPCKSFPTLPGTCRPVFS